MKLDDDIKALFALPLGEFIGARNALASRLKRDGRGDEADRVKALAKPSISAWAVNQLYWKQRKAFDRLMAAVQRFREAQASQLAGKASDIRSPLEARREALSDLSHLAAALLREADHNPTSDMMRRIATTLEAMSAYASAPDTPPSGQLTADLNPPGFDSFSGLSPGAGMTDRPERQPQVSPPRKPAGAPASPGKKAQGDDAREREEKRQVGIAAAKALLANAERALSEARARARGAELMSRRAEANAKEAEKHKRDAEERLEKAAAAAEEAARRAHSMAVEAEAATKAVEGAERAVEKAAGELQELLPNLRAR